MTAVTLKDPAAFGSKLLELYLQQGFQGLTKRDLDLLIFLLLEKDGAIQRSSTNYDVARLLRVTPRKVRALRQDAYARWRPLVGDDRTGSLQRILTTYMTPEAISSGARHASEKTQKEGFLAIRLEHADDRQEFEQAILDAGGIPIYERNPEVLVVRFDTLLSLAAHFGFIAKNPRELRRQLKDLAPKAEAVEEILKKNLSDLTWEDARTAFNSVGAGMVKDALTDGVSKLLRIALPFLPK